MAAQQSGAVRLPGPQTGFDPTEALEQFRAALVARDIVAPARIIADGAIHRCDAAGKNGKGDAAYLLHLDGFPAGGLENWRDGKGWERWRFDPGRAPAPEELDALRRRAETARARRGAEAEKRHAAARTRAARIWQAARLAEDGHPYLAQKGVGAHGLRVCKGALVVPLHDGGGELHNLQFIGASGAKRFLKGGQVSRLCFVIDGAADTICLTEGYATAASIHAATGFTVAHCCPR